MNINDKGWTFCKWLRVANHSGKRRMMRLDLARVAWRRCMDPATFNVR